MKKPKQDRPRMIEGDRLITVEELSAKIGISPGTIRNLKCKHLLPIPHAKILGRLRFKMSDVLAYIDESMDLASGSASRDRLISVKEFCEITGMPKATLYTMICNRELPIPHVKLTSRLQFKLSDVLAWIESRTIVPVASRLVPDQVPEPHDLLTKRT